MKGLAVGIERGHCWLVPMQNLGNFQSPQTNIWIKPVKCFSGFECVNSLEKCSNSFESKNKPIS